MTLELEKATGIDRPILERLLQLELYEMGFDPGPDGLIDWGESLDKFFADPSCVPLFLKTDHQLAGFTLVKLNRNLAGPDGKTPIPANLVEEFYVTRPHRRKKIGTHAIDLLLKDFPGRWIITTWPDAQRVAFWRQVTLNSKKTNGREFGPTEHAGFPGQYVWVIEP